MFKSKLNANLLNRNVIVNRSGWNLLAAPSINTLKNKAKAALKGEAALAKFYKFYYFTFEALLNEAS